MFEGLLQVDTCRSLINTSGITRFIPSGYRWVVLGIALLTFCLLLLTNFEIFGCDEGSWALTQPPRDVVGENSHHAPSNVGVCWSASKSVAVWVRLRFMGFNPKPKQASGGTESISAPVDKTSQSNELLLSRVIQAAKTPSSDDLVVWTQPKHSFSTPLFKVRTLQINKQIKINPVYTPSMERCLIWY